MINLQWWSIYNITQLRGQCWSNVGVLHQGPNHNLGDTADCEENSKVVHPGRVEDRGGGWPCCSSCKQPPPTKARNVQPPWTHGACTRPTSPPSSASPTLSSPSPPTRLSTSIDTCHWELEPGLQGLERDGRAACWERGGDAVGWFTGGLSAAATPAVEPPHKYGLDTGKGITLNYENVRYCKNIILFILKPVTICWFCDACMHVRLSILRPNNNDERFVAINQHGRGPGHILFFYCSWILKRNATPNFGP